MKIDLIDTPKYLNKEITLFGWIDVRRDHGKLIFFDLRDRSGRVQLVIAPEPKEVHSVAETLRPEWVVKVRGEIAKRPEAMVNPKEINGSLELKVKEITVLAEAKTPPFDISNEGYDIDEEIRMKYRYLDLRRGRLQKNVDIRHRLVKFIRDFMDAKGFVEIETPLLTRSTPEGARDYIVPSRLHQGKFYALPQSPQQYKQLLMVAGIEKYFQIARCFRDEDTRQDRQPEFTQLDLEMSFADEDEIMSLIEELYSSLVKTLYPEKRIVSYPFPRISFKEAMTKYQSDRPDLRGNKNNSEELAFLFVTDFPMFEWKEGDKRWGAVHHPFTKIKNQKSKIKDIRNPEEFLAHQYDLVLNGYEVGGGSIRETDSEKLEEIFEFLGHSKKEIREKFGHLLDAFEYGVPPHGGIALGLDRLIAIFMNEPNIREVIAFPKTGDGRDLLMGAPAEVEKAQLDELGIQVKKSKKSR